MRRSILLTVFSGLLAAVFCLPWAAQGSVATPAAPVRPAVAAPAAAHGSPGKVFKYRTFQTPSSNIHCGGLRNGHKYSIRCDIYEHYWSVGSGNCSEGDYGSSVGMRGRGGYPHFICVSDAVPSGKVLYYGSYWHMGPMTCRSKSVGLTCWNGAGHGWFLSRESYNLF